MRAAALPGQGEPPRTHGQPASLARASRVPARGRASSLPPGHGESTVPDGLAAGLPGRCETLPRTRGTPPSLAMAGPRSRASMAPATLDGRAAADPGRERPRSPGPGGFPDPGGRGLPAPSLPGAVVRGRDGRPGRRGGPRLLHGREPISREFTHDPLQLAGD
ncbi:MAG: hypothetical protein LBT40_08405 [Deltaproteobacteria bacterium]|nr:hypothetical protein [Deltaproteobacteria bacterium]